MAIRNKPGVPKLDRAQRTAPAEPAAPAAGNYYSPREYRTQSGTLGAQVQERKTAMEQQAAALREQQKAMEELYANANKARERYYELKGRFVGDSAAEYEQRILDEWTAATRAYAQSRDAYGKAYDTYKPYEDAYNQAVTAYDDYNAREDADYQAWRATVRDAESIRAERAEIGKLRQELRTRMTDSNYYANDPLYMPAHEAQANEERIRELQEYLGGIGDREKLLEEELGWSEKLHWEELRQNADFAQGSRYGQENGDYLYNWINTGGKADPAGLQNPVSAPAEYLHMDEREIAMYNYVYSTQGAEGAKAYLEYLRPELSQRRGDVNDEAQRAWAGENPGWASGISVALSPVSGVVSAAGQVAAKLMGEELDPNAGYNALSNTKNNLREGVAQKIEQSLGDFWGPAGSFAYNIGMSMADMLADSLTGNPAASMALIGSRSFAESAIDAKNRGLSDAQAMSLGLTSAAAELLTERIGLDELLRLPEGWQNAGFWKGLLKGAAGEASEEGLTNLANLVADLDIAGEKSEFVRNVEGYRKEGKSDQEALLAALKDAGISLALDAIGGALSGGVFGGVQGFRGKRAADAQQKTENAANTAAGEASENASVGIETSEAVSFENHAEIKGSPEDTTVETKETAVQEPVTAETAVEGPTVRPAPVAGQYGTIQNDVGGNNDGGTENNAGAGVPDGERKRGAGTGSGEQTFGLDDSPEGRLQRRQRQAETASRRAGFAHNSERLGQTRKVSPRELGIATGSQADFLIEIPKEQWDPEMQAVAQRTETVTGRKVRYVDRPVAVVDQKGKKHYVAGVIDGDQIVIDAAHSKYTVEQIADHEEYHSKAEFAGAWLNEKVRQAIVDAVGEERLQETVSAYTGRLEWMNDIPDDASDEELDRLAEKAEAEILEELLADAYAGINRFEGHAHEFQAVVDACLDANRFGKAARNQVARGEEVAGNTGQDAVRSADDADTDLDWDADVGEENAASDTEPVKYLEDDADIQALYSGRKLSEDAGLYSYAFLTSLPDMRVVPLPDVDTIRNEAGKIDKADVIDRGTKNALSVGTERAGKPYVKNRYTGRELRIDTATIRHSLNGEMRRWLTNARIGCVIGEVIQNAVPINALHNTANGVEGTYIMASYCVDTTGREFVPLVTVEQRNGAIVGIDTYDVAHSVSGRQKRSNRLDTKSQGVYPTAAASKISISKLLGVVKETYQSVLSEDVLSEIGEARNPEGYYYGRAKYLEDDAEISQEQIDAMIKQTNEMVERKAKAESEKGLRALQRKMERNRERAQQHAENRRRLQEEAKAKIAKEPVNDTPAPETKLTAQKPYFAKRNARKLILDTFHVAQGQRIQAGKVIEGYLDHVLEKGYLEDGDLRNLMDKLIDQGVVELEADEIMAEGRGYLKGQRIYISPEQIREWGDDWDFLKKKAFGLGVYLTTDRKYAGLDVWNADMASYLPGIFDENETDPRTQLERLLRVAAEGRAEKMSLSEYTKMLAEQEYQSEGELLEAMAQELNGILQQFARDSKMEIRMRRYAKDAMDRQRIYREADKAHYREHLQKMRNRRELNQLQERTLKTLKWLKQNQHRITEEMDGKFKEEYGRTVQDVLGSIDLFAIGAADELNWHPKYQMTWRDLADVYKKAAGSDNFLPSAELNRIVDRLDKEKIADMDIGALTDLLNAAIQLRKEIFDAGKLLSFEDDRRIDGIFQEIKGEMEQAKKGKTDTFWDKFFNTQQLAPMNVLRQMGGWKPDGAMATMAGLLEQGEKEVRAYTVKANRILEDWLNEHADWVHKADGQGKDGIWIEVEVPELKDIGLDGGAEFGDTVKVKMTPMQRVHLYLESKNEDNLRHMVGGRTFADPELYSRGKRDEALAKGITVKMAPETVKALVKNLSPEELELANLLDRYYNGMAHDEINRVSMTLYGYEKAMGKRYAPIFTNQNYTNSEAGIFNQTAEGVGNLKARVHAGNPSYNISALDAFERNVSKTAEFVGMAVPVRDWNNLMNWRTKDTSMKDEVSHQWGSDRLKYIDKLLVDLQGGTPQETDAMQEVADKLQSNYISSVFGFNPSIVLKQLGSLPMAAAYLGGKNMSWDMVKKTRRDRAFIAKYTQELAWRSMGYAMPETKQLKEKPSLIRDGGKKLVSKGLGVLSANKLSQETRDRFAEDWLGGGWITRMDEGAASILWAWAENKVQKEHPDLEIGDQKTVDSDASPFYRKVAEEFDRAVSHSQSVSDVMHQGTMRRSKGVMARTFTMFRSDSAQTYNALRQMWGEMEYHKQQQERYAESDNELAKQKAAEAEQARKAAGKRVGTVLIATACNLLIAEAVNLGMAALKGKLEPYEDEEEELTALSILEEMGWGMLEGGAGIVTYGDELASVLGRLITGESGYAEEAPGLEQVMELTSRIEKVAANARNGDPLAAVREIGMAFSTFCAGFPAENMEKLLIGGVLRHLVPGVVTGYEDALEAPDKSDLKGLEGAALEVRVGNVMKGYGVELDDGAEAILAQLYGAGYTQAVAGGAPDAVKVNGEELDLDKQMKKRYDQSRVAVLNQELAAVLSSPFFTEADDETKAKMLDRLYDYAAEKAKKTVFAQYEASDTVAEYAEIAQAGGSIADCVIFKTITGGISGEPEMKNFMKADLLREWDAEDQVKELMFRYLITDSQDEEIIELRKTGVSMDQFLEAYAMHGQIDAQSVTAKDKATEFAYWLDGQRYSAAQKNAIKEQMEFRTSLVVQADRYNDATAAGLDREEAAELVEELAALEPMEGKADVLEVQKWRVAIDRSLNENNQLKLLKSVGMNDAAYAKCEALWNEGIAPAAYVRAYELKDNFNSDGQGDLTNEDWKRLINSMTTTGIVLPGDNNRFMLTNEQKGYLWQMLTGSKSTKNNPYSAKGGQMWLEAKEK